MLKKVGASGQISLGKRYAGRLFEMVIHPEDRVELIPMRVVADNPGKTQASPSTWRPPGGYSQANAWALENRDALEAYASRIEREGTAADQLQRYLAQFDATSSER